MRSSSPVAAAKPTAASSRPPYMGWRTYCITPAVLGEAGPASFSCRPVEHAVWGVQCPTQPDQQRLTQPIKYTPVASSGSAHPCRPLTLLGQRARLARLGQGSQVCPQRLLPSHHEAQPCSHADPASALQQRAQEAGGEEHGQGQHDLAGKPDLAAAAQLRGVQHLLGHLLSRADTWIGELACCGHIE